MAHDLPRSGERDGTRKLMISGAAIAAILFMGLGLWFAAPQLFGVTDHVGRRSTGADKGTPATTAGTGVPTQRDAVSTAAKQDPAGNEDSSGLRARQIKKSSRPANLSEQQREQLRSILATSRGPAMDRPNFEMMIGTSVPRQTETADLPPEATQILDGFWGDQYLIAGKSLVIVDQHSRRVAAVIADVQ